MEIEIRVSKALLLVIACAILCKETYRLWMAWKSLEWRPIPGTVLKAMIAPIAGDETESYEPQVSYRYKINGRWYESRCLWYRPTYLPDYSDAIAALSGIAKGKVVTVYVDPANPQRAVLVRGPNRWNYLLCGLLFLFVVFSGLLVP
jgi:hypothetical protein